jgi:hypothetical protein
MLVLMLDSKLYFHCHVDFVYSQALRTLGLMRYIIHNLSSQESLVALYNASIRSMLEYAFAIWYNNTCTDYNKRENRKIRNANLCYSFSV